MSGSGSVRNGSCVMVGLPTAVNCGSNRRTALRRTSLTLTRTNFGAGILQVLDSDLHREKRIAQFVSKASGEFAPGSHALGLEKTLFLRSEGSRHVVEGDGELADFIASTNFDARIPSSGGDFAGAFG